MVAVYRVLRRCARAIITAYRRLPVRWRLGGGSATLTFIILAVFGIGVGVLTDRQKNQEFNATISAQADHLANFLRPEWKHNPKLHNRYALKCTTHISGVDLWFDAHSANAQIQVLDQDGLPQCTQEYGWGVTAQQAARIPSFSVPTNQQSQGPSTYAENGYRVAARAISWTVPIPKPKSDKAQTATKGADGDRSKGQGKDQAPAQSQGKDQSKGQGKDKDQTKSKSDAPQTKTVSGYLIYAEPISAVTNPISEIHLWLTVGVLGGAVLALLAGLLVADRAMRPIAELTDVARDIERTRDPTLSIPHPVANDEVAELARTLEGMLSALDEARNEAVSALARQREFVADASHELRTPLTSVLANLELLADELEGEPADSARSALMATRRMRRLVGDLLLLARADVERQKTLTTVDLADTVTNAAVELGPVAEAHHLEVTPGRAPLTGLQDDLHRMVLNLIENAVHHTPPGTHIHASSAIEDGQPVLIVEDNGPGIPPDMQTRVFERFVRGGGDRGSRGTGLGLAIVSAVAEAHDASVTLTSLPQLQGTRFEIRFAAFPVDAGSGSGPAGPEPEMDADQTSTTTGRTIGRRRRRS